MKQRQHKDTLVGTAKLQYPDRRKTSPSRKKQHADHLKRLCWGLIPAVTASLLVLDAKGIYTFNTERLLVLGIGLLVLLLPCFSEVTIKDLTVRRDKSDK